MLNLQVQDMWGTKCLKDSRHHEFKYVSGGYGRLCNNCFKQNFPDEFKLTES